MTKRISVKVRLPFFCYCYETKFLFTIRLDEAEWYPTSLAFAQNINAMHVNCKSCI